MKFSFASWGILLFLGITLWGAMELATTFAAPQRIPQITEVGMRMSQPAAAAQATSTQKQLKEGNHCLNLPAESAKEKQIKAACLLRAYGRLTQDFAEGKYQETQKTLQGALDSLQLAAYINARDAFDALAVGTRYIDTFAQSKALGTKAVSLQRGLQEYYQGLTKLVTALSYTGTQAIPCAIGQEGIAIFEDGVIQISSEVARLQAQATTLSNETQQKQAEKVLAALLQNTDALWEDAPVPLATLSSYRIIGISHPLLSKNIEARLHAIAKKRWAVEKILNDRAEENTCLDDLFDQLRQDEIVRGQQGGCASLEVCQYTYMRRCYTYCCKSHAPTGSYRAAQFVPPQWCAKLEPQNQNIPPQPTTTQPSETTTSSTGNLWDTIKDFWRLRYESQTQTPQQDTSQENSQTAETPADFDAERAPLLPSHPSEDANATPDTNTPTFREAEDTSMERLEDFEDMKLAITQEAQKHFNAYMTEDGGNKDAFLKTYTDCRMAGEAEYLCASVARAEAQKDTSEENILREVFGVQPVKQLDEKDVVREYRDARKTFIKSYDGVCEDVFNCTQAEICGRALWIIGPASYCDKWSQYQKDKQALQELAEERFATSRATRETEAFFRQYQPQVEPAAVAAPTDVDIDTLNQRLEAANAAQRPSPDAVAGNQEHITQAIEQKYNCDGVCAKEDICGGFGGYRCWGKGTQASKDWETYQNHLTKERQQQELTWQAPEEVKATVGMLKQQKSELEQKLQILKREYARLPQSEKVPFFESQRAKELLKQQEAIEKELAFNQKATNFFTDNGTYKPVSDDNNPFGRVALARMLRSEKEGERLAARQRLSQEEPTSDAIKATNTLEDITLAVSGGGVMLKGVRAAGNLAKNVLWNTAKKETQQAAKTTATQASTKITQYFRGRPLSENTARNTALRYQQRLAAELKQSPTGPGQLNTVTRATTRSAGGAAARIVPTRGVGTTAQTGSGMQQSGSLSLAQRIKNALPWSGSATSGWGKWFAFGTLGLVLTQDTPIDQTPSPKADPAQGTQPPSPAPPKTTPQAPPNSQPQTPPETPPSPPPPPPQTPPNLAERMRALQLQYQQQLQKMQQQLKAQYQQMLAQQKARFEEMKRQYETAMRNRQYQQQMQQLMQARMQQLFSQAQRQALAQQLTQRIQTQRQNQPTYRISCAMVATAQTVKPGEPVAVKWELQPFYAVAEAQVVYQNEQTGAIETETVPRIGGKVFQFQAPGTYQILLFGKGRFGGSCRDGVAISVAGAPAEEPDDTPSITPSVPVPFFDHTTVQNTWFAPETPITTDETPTPPDMARLYLAPNPIYAGGSVRIYWQGTGVCELTGPAGLSRTLEGTGLKEVTTYTESLKPGSYPFRLRCGNASDGAVLVVLPKEAPAPRTNTPRLPQQVTEQNIKQSKCPVFRSYLKRGDQGPDVQVLEEFLRRYGYFTNEPDMLFDRETEKAVKAFQAEHAVAILKPWGTMTSTGYWYKYSRWYANKLVGCLDPDFNPDLPWQQ